MFWKNLFYILLWWSPFIGAMVLIQTLGWQAAWALRMYAAEILLVGIVTPIVLRIVFGLLRRQRSLTMPAFLNFDVQLTFRPDGLHVVSAKEQLYLRWDSFTKCIRTHQGFLLLWGNNRCSMIQNTAIEGQRGVERLFELLKEHISEYTERSEQQM